MGLGQFEIQIMVVLVSAVLVWLDARSLWAKIEDRSVLQGMAASSPGMWGFATAFVWILVLPLYLIMRPKLVAAGGPRLVATKKCARCDQQYDATYDGCPHCAKS